MAKHGLTRVQFRGDQTIIIAGPTPDHIAVEGLTKELIVEEPVITPMTPVRATPQKPNKPARHFEAKPQADVKETK